MTQTQRAGMALLSHQLLRVALHSKAPIQLWGDGIQSVCIYSGRFCMAVRDATSASYFLKKNNNSNQEGVISYSVL